MELNENSTTQLQTKAEMTSDRAFERMIARNVANACLKTVFIQQTKRPLGSLMGRIRNLDRRISQVANHG